MFKYLNEYEESAIIRNLKYMIFMKKSLQYNYFEKFKTFKLNYNSALQYYRDVQLVMNNHHQRFGNGPVRAVDTYDIMCKYFELEGICTIEEVAQYHRRQSTRETIEEIAVIHEIDKSNLLDDYYNLKLSFSDACLFFSKLCKFNLENSIFVNSELVMARYCDIYLKDIVLHPNSPINLVNQYVSSLYSGDWCKNIKQIIYYSALGKVFNSSCEEIYNLSELLMQDISYSDVNDIVELCTDDRLEKFYNLEMSTELAIEYFNEMVECEYRSYFFVGIEDIIEKYIKRDYYKDFDIEGLKDILYTQSEFDKYEVIEDKRSTWNDDGDWYNNFVEVFLNMSLAAKKLLNVETIDFNYLDLALTDKEEISNNPFILESWEYVHKVMSEVDIEPDDVDEDDMHQAYLDRFYEAYPTNVFAINFKGLVLTNDEVSYLNSAMPNTSNGETYVSRENDGSLTLLFEEDAMFTMKMELYIKFIIVLCNKKRGN